ncbi:MAG: hypothetical protein IT555_10175 [Acetobacteraceae bacterium]|nr:hypothetical protein [Acetobacteraceae bacterium]
MRAGILGAPSAMVPMLPATRLRYIAALDAAVEGDADRLAAAFAGVTGEVADKLGRHLVNGLALVARVTGDWKPYGFAVNRVPWSYQRPAAVDLQQRVDAWTVAKRPQPDSPRRRLARLAMKLIRAGTPGRDVLRQLDQANATMPAPIAAETVGELARWAATEVRRLPRVA